jgi:hypothetical protein
MIFYKLANVTTTLIFKKFKLWDLSLGSFLVY